MKIEKVRIGLMGAWQSHIYRFADYILQDGHLKIDSTKHWLDARYDDCEIVSVWDSESARGKKLAEYCSCKYVEDIDAFVNDPDMDAVIMCSETAKHSEHTIKCANAGKHVFVEKAPFVTLEDAYLARDAVKRSGIHFMVSSPMDKPRNRYILKMAEEGLLGTITEVRFRLYGECIPDDAKNEGIYNKEENGGGAMIDYGQHGVHIAQLFLGAPETCSAHFGYVTKFAKEHHTEDNACAIYGYENGAQCVVETGWCAPSHECILDVCGTKGTAHLVGDAKEFLDNGKHVVKDYMSYRLNGREWVNIPESDFPEKYYFPLRHWLNNVKNDTPDDRFTVDDAVLWTEMLASAYASAEQDLPIMN